MAAFEEARRKDEAAAEERRKEEARIAALEEARRSEEKRKEEERLRLAIPDDDRRVEFVRKIQEVLKRNHCYDGAVNGRHKDTQEGLNSFVEHASSKGISKPARIDLAKANVGDFESWLRDAEAIKSSLCTPARPIVREDKVRPATRAKVTKAVPERQEKAQRVPAQTRAAVRDPEACFNRCHAAGGRRGSANRCNRRCAGG